MLPHRDVWVLWTSLRRQKSHNDISLEANMLALTLHVDDRGLIDEDSATIMTRDMPGLVIF